MMGVGNALCVKLLLVCVDAAQPKAARFSDWVEATKYHETVFQKENL